MGVLLIYLSLLLGSGWCVYAVRDSWLPARCLVRSGGLILGSIALYRLVCMNPKVPAPLDPSGRLEPFVLQVCAAPIGLALIVIGGLLQAAHRSAPRAGSTVSSSGEQPGDAKDPSQSRQEDP